jgi:hypothetical protein
MSAFKSSRKGSQQWEDLQKALRVIKSLDLDITIKEERNLEDRLAAVLSGHFKDFIDQRSIKQVMTMVPLFDHSHRPDMSIGTDNVAFEMKLIKDANSFREAIGQAIIYRTGYRFVVIVWKDLTSQKRYKKAFENEREKALVEELEEMNIFCVVK